MALAAAHETAPESAAPATAPIEAAARRGDWRPLTAGWLVLPTDRLTGFPIGEGPGERRFFLMHADYGAAVLDLWSPEAMPPGGDAPVSPACLDAQIRLATFLRRFDPRLPIHRIHLAEPELPRLTGVLARAFAGMEPLRLGDGGAWMEAVQDALAAPPAMAPPPPAPRPPARGGGFGARRLGLAIGSAFALGAAAALALLVADGGPTASVPRSPAVSAEAQAPFDLPAQEAQLADLVPPALDMARAWPLPVAWQPAPPPAAEPAAGDPIPPGEALHLLPLALPDGLAPRLSPSMAMLPLPLPEPGAALPALPGSASIAAAMLLPEQEPAGPVAPVAGAAKAPSPVPPPMPTQPVPGVVAKPAAVMPMPMPMPEMARDGVADIMPATPLPEPEAPRIAAEPDPAPSPPPAAGPAPALDAAVIALLIDRGEAMLARGDISAARLLFGRAAAAGSAAALTAMGRSYDPAVLGALGVRGIRPDPDQAALWYRRAADHGTMP